MLCYQDRKTSYTGNMEEDLGLLEKMPLATPLSIGQGKWLTLRLFSIDLVVVTITD